MNTDKLHGLILAALAASNVADQTGETATKSRSEVTKSLFLVAKECAAGANTEGDNPESRFNAGLSWLYQHLATAAGATFCQEHNIILVASKRKDYPFKLPQSFLNATSVLRGALKRGILKGSYSATKKAKAEAVADETASKNARKLRDETLGIEVRERAAESLARVRFNNALEHLTQSFAAADVHGKEKLAGALEDFAKAHTVTKAAKTEVHTPRASKTKTTRTDKAANA